MNLKQLVVISSLRGLSVGTPLVKEVRTIHAMSGPRVQGRQGFPRPVFPVLLQAVGDRLPAEVLRLSILWEMGKVPRTITCFVARSGLLICCTIG